MASTIFGYNGLDFTMDNQQETQYSELKRIGFLETIRRKFRYFKPFHLLNCSWGREPQEQQKNSQFRIKG